MVGNANANGIPFLKRYGIPPAIKNSMVLWYDIARQGATNESMAENPILKDLSGNGHDATCYNFAWEGMSGIGGFVFADSDFFTYSDKPVTVSNHIITLNKCNYVESLIYNPDKYTDANTERIVVNRPAFKIKVSGVGENEYIRIHGSLFNGSKWREQNIISNVGNGMTDIPAINQTYNRVGTESNNLIYQDFIITLRSTDNSESPSESVITIEILPQYPNALVSDGIDDYAYVEGLPILTDYTVIAKRIWLSSQMIHTFASKSEIAGQGAFIFEISDLNAEVYSYGTPNSADIVSDIISYQTTNEYNGKKINKGSNRDTDKLWISKLRNNNTYIGSFAIYSFLLFNRTLTAEEIEWVKANLIK